MIDVLFVDDDLALAEAWSQRIARTMQLKTQATSVPSEAVALVRDPGVKVAVIDQVLVGTGTDGVTLGKDIQEADSRVRWILLSGEATGAQITAAYDSGLQRHIHKNDALDKLPPAIRQYLVEHSEALTRSTDLAGRPLLVTRTGALRRPAVKYYLVTIDSVDREFTSSDEWVSHTQLNSGEQLEETFELGWTRADTFEFTAESNIDAGINLGSGQVVKLSTSLRSQIRRQERLESVVTESRSYKLVRTLSLPPEPQDPTVLHVRSRSFEVAPVYVKIDVTLAARCSCCSHDEAIKGSIFFPRNRFATRQEDFLSDGTNKVTDTGSKDLSNTVSRKSRG
jgi:ActR/RegA family two-component response regulator